jgi:hypothetical protein
MISARALNRLRVNPVRGKAIQNAPALFPRLVRLRQSISGGFSCLMVVDRNCG